MIILWGSRFYGKVDKVAGLFYVVTRFGHLWFIPLIPTASYLILDTPGEQGDRGVRISMSLKSVFFGWLRAASVFGLVAGVIGSLVGLSDGKAGVVYYSAAWIGVSGVALVLSYVFSKASPRRAVELGKHLGISEEAMYQYLAPQEEKMRDAPVDIGADLDISPERRRRYDDDRDDDPPNTSIRRG